MIKALLVLLLSLSAFFASGKSIDDMFVEAWASKDTTPETLSVLLDKLSKESMHFSAKQQLEFDFLEGYRLGLSGQPLMAIEKYKRVIANSGDDTLRLQASTALLQIYTLTRRTWMDLKQLRMC